MGRKNIKNMYDMGKKVYDFDYELEKNIYCNLSFIDLKTKPVRKLDERLKFNYYVEWEQYVYNKYKDFAIVNLKEFSRFLNQIIRNTEPTREYWNICIPIVLTIMSTKLFEIIMEMGEIDFSGYSNKSAIIMTIIMIMLLYFLIGSLVFLGCRLINPLWDNNTREYFLLDYKEIIDKIIEEKTEAKEDTNHQ